MWSSLPDGRRATTLETTEVLRRENHLLEATARELQHENELLRSILYLQGLHAEEALAVLVDALLDRARSAAWNVLRTAYRDVNLRAVPCAPADMTGTTGQWLARSLVLGPRAAGKHDGEGGVRWYRDVEAWLEARLGKGEARRKEGEGMEGRWILVKA